MLPNSSSATRTDSLRLPELSNTSHAPKQESVVAQHHLRRSLSPGQVTGGDLWLDAEQEHYQSLDTANGFENPLYAGECFRSFLVHDVDLVVQEWHLDITCASPNFY